MFFLLVVASYHLFFYLDGQAEKKLLVLHHNTTRLSPIELATVEEGDIILRRGFGYFSDIIAKKLNTGSYDITHAGIIVKRLGKLYVIHSLSSDVSEKNGVQIQPLSTFLVHSEPNKIMITRVKNSDTNTGKKIASLAEHYLAQNIPFDPNGNYDDSTSFFCTEIIWKILEKDIQLVKLPQQPEARKAFFYSMTPMYSTQYFDIKVNQYQ